VSDVDPWITQARIGADAEAFLNSQVGRKLQERANRIIQKSTVELIKSDPEDVEAGRKLRREIQRAGDAIDWLIEMRNDGDQAREEIREQEVGD